MSAIPEQSPAARWTARLFVPALVTVIAAVFSCKTGSTPAVYSAIATSKPATSAPVFSEELQASAPATMSAKVAAEGGYVVTEDTVLVRGGPDGKPIFTPVLAGTRVALARDLRSRRADEFVEVRTPDGVVGRVPFARLKQLVVVTAPKKYDAPAAVARAEEPEKANRVRDAIRRGVNFLVAQQEADGSWEHVPAPVAGPAGSLDAGQWGFTSAMATLALFDAGENFQSPKVSIALKALLDAKNVRGVYAVAARVNVWSRYPGHGPNAKPYGNALKSDCTLLFNGARAGAGGRLDYGYDLSQPQVGPTDHLATMFVQRAAAAASRNGREAPANFWKLLQVGWNADQAARGGWMRSGPAVAGDEPSATDTLIGIRALTANIPEEFLARDCKGGRKTPTDRAWSHLFKIWERAAIKPTELEPGAGPELQNLSTMILVEALCERGTRRIDDEDLIDEAVRQLIRLQNPDGSFSKKLGSSRVVETALAVIALSRARQPMMICKLIDDRPDCEQRPFDVRQLAASLGPLCYIFNGDAQRVRPKDLSKMGGLPLLYISGSNTFKLPPDEVSALRDFVERGGMIFANADCGSRKFARSIEDLGKQVAGAYEFRELPTSHPIFHQMFSAAKWRTPQKLRGLSNGVRELIVLSQGDVGGDWNDSGRLRHPEACELGANVVLYMGGNLPFPGEFVAPAEADGKPITDSSKVVSVARLLVGNNPDPEPGGWQRMRQIMDQQCGTKLDVVNLAPEVETLAGFEVAHLTGTGTFTLSKEERIALSKFVGSGGTLLIDAAGGSTEFANAAIAELQTIFGPEAARQLAQPLSKGHPIFQFPHHVIDTFKYTTSARNLKKNVRRDPDLRGIDINGRTAIFFSDVDLSAALVGRLPAGVVGYEPDTATAIVRNVLLYSVSEQ